MNKITTISPINRRFTSFSDSFLLMILPAMPPPIAGKEDNIPSTRPIATQTAGGNPGTIFVN